VADVPTEGVALDPQFRPAVPGVHKPAEHSVKAKLDAFRAYLDARAEPSNSRTRRENVLLALYATAIDRRRRDQIAAVRVILAYDLGLPAQALQVDHSSGDGSMSRSSNVVIYLPDNGRCPRPRLAEPLVDATDDRTCLETEPVSTEGDGS
jgi:hypothetical protein